MSEEAKAEETEAVEIEDFLLEVPPNSERLVSDLIWARAVDDALVFGLPHEIPLHCEHCNEERVFEPVYEVEDPEPDPRSKEQPYIGDELEEMKARARKDENIDRRRRFIAPYRCRACQRGLKLYALEAAREYSGRLFAERLGSWKVLKIGEHPPSVPPIPPRFNTVMLNAQTRALFLNGRRCEAHGLGIGAFVYYRRVVEERKQALLDEILRVVNAMPGDQTDLTKELKAAKEERQFTRAVEKLQQNLPDALLVHGQSPLTLLHKVLSEGLHEKTDEQCLAMAVDVRKLLFALCERMGVFLDSEAELAKTTKRLMNRKRTT